jgi:hypothetical protein
MGAGDGVSPYAAADALLERAGWLPAAAEARR